MPQESEVRRKVLFADDEAEILELLEMTLEDDERYRVLLASNGEEALALCRAGHPELAFLDIRMPKLDGIDVCREIRNDPAMSDMAVVMLTGNAQEIEIDRAMEAGADDYMTKPFSPTALHQKMLAALGLPDLDIS